MCRNTHFDERPINTGGPVKDSPVTKVTPVMAVEAWICTVLSQTTSEAKENTWLKGVLRRNGTLSPNGSISML